MDKSRDRYIAGHSSPQGEALEWIERQTHIRTNFPQMLSGQVQGRFLSMLVRISGARDILEIGTFTGYSAAALALALPEDGRLDTLEINDELEDITREGWRRAGVEGKINLYIADAADTLVKLSGEGRMYDLVYIDANKREYSRYYDAVMDMVRPGGLILVDDVLQGGKVYDPSPPSDRQTEGLAEFNSKVASDPRVEVVILPIRDGLSVIRKF